MRTHRNGLLAGLLLATASSAAFAAAPAPATAPPPPTMDDPGQPATAQSIKPNDPRLAPLPPDSAPSTVVTKPPHEETSKSDGDPTNPPRLPTDDAFHPPPKQANDSIVSADGFSVRTTVEPNGDRIEEYRRNGQVTKIKVQPAHGKAYEITDSNGDGRIDRADAGKNNVMPVQWTLFEWH